MGDSIRKAIWWSDGIPVSLVFIPALAAEHPLEHDDEPPPSKRRRGTIAPPQPGRDREADEADERDER